MGSTLEVLQGTPLAVFRDLTQRYSVESVFTNHDYEPYARRRDRLIEEFLRTEGAGLHTFKDQVIFERSEVMKDDGHPYTVFTPYSRKWKSVLSASPIQEYPSGKLTDAFYKQPAIPLPSLGEIGFSSDDAAFPSITVTEELLARYGEQRNFPGVRGTSKLGVHLRFGTLGIRELARRAAPLSETFLNELIWRDFYHMILWHFPQVGEGRSFKPAYDQIQWRNHEAEFDLWCRGMTGYPIVDAGMRELNQTGFMHNRVRMIVASFLTKHLLIDWRWGEAYFAAKLLDFDLAANNGGWQWASGSGCDAAPYFRIFNPALQTEKFDAGRSYIRQWVPEFLDPGYPKPVVVHEFARDRCLDIYSRALKPGGK